jgi:hypothetical protein
MRRWQWILLSALAAAAVLTPQLSAQALPCPTCGREDLTVTPKPHRVSSLEAGTTSSDISRAFSLANAKRAKAGLGPLGYDPEMTRGAQIKADSAAANRIKGHQGGSMYGGNKEGVGWSSGPETPAACYLMTAPAGTPSGFAMAHGEAGWHSVLLISHDVRLSSGKISSGPLRRMIPNRGGGWRPFGGRFRR